MAKVVDEPVVGDPVAALPGCGHPRVRGYKMFDTAKVGAELASPFHQPQLIFVAVAFFGSFEMGRRPTSDSSAYPTKGSSANGLGEKEQADKRYEHYQ